MSVVMRETGDLHSDEGAAGSHESQMMMGKYRSSSVWEIEEEGVSSSELFEICNGGTTDDDPIMRPPSIKEELDGSLFSFDFHNGGDDVVYVAVGRSSDESISMDALVWTLNHAVTTTPNCTPLVFLIHVFPEVRFIPTPLGKLPINQVNPEQKENHMIQERSKRREFLQKFIDACYASKVKVDTILIESDMEAKALLDLIPILNIRKLVLGTTKSNLRKLLRSRKGSGGIADQVLENAPEFCEVKIICEGKEVVVDSLSDQPPSPSSGKPVDSPKAPPTPPTTTTTDDQETRRQRNDSFGCSTCFKPKVIA